MIDRIMNRSLTRIIRSLEIIALRAGREKSEIKKKINRYREIYSLLRQQPIKVKFQPIRTEQNVSHFLPDVNLYSTDRPSYRDARTHLKMYLVGVIVSFKIAKKIWPNITC